MDEPKAITVVLPVYGSFGPVPALMRDLTVAAYALRCRGMHLDVLLLDGGSGEAGREAARDAENLGLPLEVAPGPAAGPGNAYVDGFRRVVDAGRADLVATLDATGRHDPTQIPHLIDRLVTSDLDVVIGSRWVRGSGTPGLSPSRWALGRLADALEVRYSDLDYKAGHYRRYVLPQLSRLTEAAGLVVEKARYFDVLGVVSYYLVYKLLRQTDISGSPMWGYDRVVVPVSRALQRVLRRPPLGENVLLVATKP